MMAHADEGIALSDSLLKQVVERILSAGDPLMIVLFGSRARGDSRPDSDLDLLVVEESGLPRHRRSPRYYHATRGLFPARDILVWTPEEIKAWEAVPNHFVTVALHEGRVLYERSG